MNKSNAIGFGLLAVLLIIFFVMQSRYASEEQKQEAQKKEMQDSIAALQQLKTDSLQHAEEDTTASPAPNSADIAAGAAGKTKPDTTAGKKTDTLPASLNPEITGPFAAAATGNDSDIVLENTKLRIVFSTKGGIIKTAELKDYKDYLGNPLRLIDNAGNTFGYTFFYDKDKKISTADLYFTPIPSADGKSVTFRLNAGNGTQFDQVYTLNDTDYLVNYNIHMTGFDKVIPAQIPSIIVDWRDYMPQLEKNEDYERRYSNLYFSYTNGDDDYKNANGEIKFDGQVKWVSCQQQFFNATLIADKNFDNSGKIELFSADTATYDKRCDVMLYIPYDKSADYTFSMHWYLAPNRYKDLKQFDIGLEKIVPTGTGISAVINKFAIIPLFNWLGGFIRNYGLIILLMTLIIRLVLSPLTYRSYVSMAKMRVLMPEMSELKEKYKDDQAKLGQEQLKLYRKAGVSPLGGCIPTLLSMPILISMFRFFPGSIELRQQSFLWAKDLSTYDDLIHWNASIPFIGTHISLFCLLMTASSLMYIRLNMQNSAQLQGGMKTVQYIFPFFLFFFLNNSPAALTYYYFVSNLSTFAQQGLIRKFLINEKAIHARIQENKNKPTKKSRFQARLESAMREQQKLKEARAKQGGKKK